MSEKARQSRVLIVDDVSINIYILREMLSSYDLYVDTAESGFEAIDKIKDGNIYDVIFMDHMMPIMHGIEATKKIRGMGYTGCIVALTADTEEKHGAMFLENGFDRYAAKPISPEQLEEIMQNCTGQNSLSDANLVLPDVEELFLIDAAKAVKTLKDMDDKIKAQSGADIHLYTVTLHGMKSALLSIGETELSKDAYELEKASEANDTLLMAEQTPVFIRKLEELIRKSEAALHGAADGNIKEETAYFRAKLNEVRLACNICDKGAAQKALAELGSREWPEYIDDIIDELNVRLLHDSFTAAATAAGNAARNVEVV
ncbi:MAG: response regulator [Oscillospiraceae bacterium]|nr:response regulator [Oscillospiraceae bacterium]